MLIEPRSFEALAKSVYIVQADFVSIYRYVLLVLTCKSIKNCLNNVSSTVCMYNEHVSSWTESASE